MSSENESKDKTWVYPIFLACLSFFLLLFLLLIFFPFLFWAVLAIVYLCVARTSKMVKNSAPILHNKYWGNPKKETGTDIEENRDVYYNYLVLEMRISINWHNQGPSPAPSNIYHSNLKELKCSIPQ